ncbi:Glu/Leu/Phe/Val family dehydrogenase [Saliterribacillus persicus]|uniref:Glutamate dehydrogenase n=1 Tax=Saliterribacillus persicus TaxID=930114 RepID=A0A368XAB3_9BACI|nr:Glu/Leu/Phe/Val dehydrogenase [Saliterribacillus persicus]RCW64890.1 glutamate dehydrogenase (NAD) [Saliterribacillus persicus]
MKNLYTSVTDMIETSLLKLGYKNDVYHLLKEPNRILKVRIPVKMDDGSTKYFQGFRVQHNDVFGITHGNVHFNQHITEEDIYAYSIIRSIKSSILNLPVGGSSGGIICDLRQLSFRELENLSRGYIRAIHHLIGPQVDVPTSDAKVDQQIMAWMLDEYSRINTGVNPGFMTGKPLVLGGLPGKEIAQIKSVQYVMEKSLEYYEKKLKETKIVIQGFGEMGSQLADSLYSSGATIIGITDAYGCIYDEEGINIPEILNRKDSFGSVTRTFPKVLPVEECYELECDVFFLTASNEALTAENAKKMKAQIVMETIPFTIEKEANNYLKENNVVVLPEIITTLGGVIHSYLEWRQYQQATHYTIKEIEDNFHKMIDKSLQDAFSMKDKKQTDMVNASYMTGLNKLAEAARFRGWI